MPTQRLNVPTLTLLLLLFATCTPDRRKENSPPVRREAESVISVVPRFSGEAAFQYLLAQTDFGPRNPGSSGHQRCRDYLIDELEKYADAVNQQEFFHAGYRGEQLRMTNIVASFNLKATNRILLAAHWDTRPYADQDPDEKNRSRPILGANDGASGVAVLLQLARIMKENPPPVGVDLVLFDGEDFGRAGDNTNFLLGSKYFARNKAPTFNPRFGVLLDMVGDAQLEIPQEKNSLRYAPEVVQHVWQLAAELGLKEFLFREGPDLYDDHVPLNEVGIKTIDLIDFNYPDESHSYWHTLEDTPDKCSPNSLEVVGTLLVHLIYEKTP